MPKALSQLIYRIVQDELRRQGVPLRPSPPVVFGSRASQPATRTPPLAYATPAALFTGGQVLATDPASFSVIQQPLTGISEGSEVTLAISQTLQVPTSPLPSTYYVVINSRGVAQIASVIGPTQLCTAAIHLPYDDTFEIRDLQPESPDDHAGWISPFNSATLGGFRISSDDPALRNAIQEIAAEGIIGDLLLSNALRISNPAGTIQITADAISIYDGEGKLRAQFDDDSVDFYDSDGFVLATFGVAEARVGNISITPHALGSSDFLAGVRGFQIRDTGNVEFQDGEFRGTLHVPALSVADYNSGSATFRFQRRRQLIQDLTVYDGAIVPFDNPDGPLRDHHGFAVPGFAQKPVIILQENIVPIYDGTPGLCSGTSVVFRRLFAEPLQMSGTGYWDAAQITATLVVSGTPGDASVVTHSGTTLGWPNYDYASYLTGQHAIFYLPGDTSNIIESDSTFGIKDGFHFPLSGTLIGASGNKVTVDLISRISANRNDVMVGGSIRYDYIIRVGKSGSLFQTNTIQSGSVTITHSKPAGVTGQDAFTYQTDRFTFSPLAMALDWAVKVDYYKFTVLSEEPPGCLQPFGPRFGAVNYHKVSSGSPITYAVVDMEITED